MTTASPQATFMQDNPTMAPLIDIAAMAAIVHELVDGGLSRVGDASWLRDRVAAAGLGPVECAALEALRGRLHIGGDALVRITSDLRWV